MGIPMVTSLLMRVLVLSFESIRSWANGYSGSRWLRTPLYPWNGIKVETCVRVYCSNRIDVPLLDGGENGRAVRKSQAFNRFGNSEFGNGSACAEFVCHQQFCPIDGSPDKRYAHRSGNVLD